MILDIQTRLTLLEVSDYALTQFTNVVLSASVNRSEMFVCGARICDQIAADRNSAVISCYAWMMTDYHLAWFEDVYTCI